MRTFIFGALLAATAVSAAQPAAAIILPPSTGGCGMTALCKPLPPTPPGDRRTRSGYFN